MEVIWVDMVAATDMAKMNFFMQDKASRVMITSLLQFK